MKKIDIQFELPVKNPEDNLRIKRGRNSLTIYAPSNCPDLHIMTITELLEKAQHAELLRLRTTHNTEIKSIKKESTELELVNSQKTIDTFSPVVAPSTV